MALLKSTGNKKVNLDFNKEFISTFSEKIESGDIQFINQTLKDLHEADVANLIENLNPDTRVKLIELESFNIDPEIFIELNESIQGEVLKLLSIESIIKIIKRIAVILFIRLLYISKYLLFICHYNYFRFWHNCYHGILNAA